MNHYLGPYVSDNFPDGTRRWSLPLGALGAIDMRSIPAHQTPGVAFITTDDAMLLGAQYRSFGKGDIRSIVPAESDRAIFASMLGVQIVLGSTLNDWLFSALTTQADPQGLLSAKPLMPTQQGNFDMWLAPSGLVKSVPFNPASPDFAPTITLMQNDYASVRTAALNGETSDPQIYLKMLAAWGKQFGINNPQDVFVPVGLPKETPIKPATVINDTFVRADESPIATSSGGWSWSALTGNAQIKSNKATNTGANTGIGAVRADSDLSSSNNYAFGPEYGSTGLSANNQSIGMICRKDSSATLSYYIALLITPVATDLQQLYKVVGGSFTILGTGATITRVDGQNCYVEANGTSITAKYNGSVTVGPITDSAVTTGLRSGMRIVDVISQNRIQFGSFEAGDLGAGASVVGSYYYRLVAGMGGI